MRNARNNRWAPPKAPQVRLRSASCFRPAARRDRLCAAPMSIRHPSVGCLPVQATVDGGCIRTRQSPSPVATGLPSDPFAHPPGRMLQVARRASLPPRCRRRRMPAGTLRRPLELGLANERRRRAGFGEGVLRCAHALRPTQRGAAQCLRTVVASASPVGTPAPSSFSEKLLRRRRKR